MNKRKRLGKQPALEGFTVVLCQAENGCGLADDAVVNPLRSAVRGSTYGLLIRGGCLARTLHCPHHARNWVPRPGIRLVVQPCTRDRKPLGSAVAFGPLTEPAQTEELADWLLTGLCQGHRPPKHLLAVRLPDHSTFGITSHTGS
ncbi:hypothetical protein [Streptomyces sp. NPDC046821]|uniref:hypothetical protein n=1 Tax=Streptomyces sp. NPDC046821 TaxID=3154702 RepID=UPI00340C6FF3